MVSANDSDINTPILMPPNVQNNHNGTYILVKFLGCARNKTTL